MDLAIFCGLAHVYIAGSGRHPSIQIVRHAQIKQNFKVVFRWKIFKWHIACICHMFII